jgi:hypothetical protein
MEPLNAAHNTKVIPSPNLGRGTAEGQGEGWKGDGRQARVRVGKGTAEGQGEGWKGDGRRPG